MGTLEASWTVEIGAPRERCFEIAADIENAPKWQGTLEEVEVRKSDNEGRAVVVETVSDAMVKKVKSTLRFSYDPPDGISWEQEEGEAKWLTGSWVFEELGGGGTRATYGLKTDPGRMLGLLLRGPIEGKVKELLTKSAAEGLKVEAEAKG
ncbi:MAG: SRPBCC family protein [Actinomycetota bacterium]